MAARDPPTHKSSLTQNHQSLSLYLALAGELSVPGKVSAPAAHLNNIYSKNLQTPITGDEQSLFTGGSGAASLLRS